MPAQEVSEQQALMLLEQLLSQRLGLKLDSERRNLMRFKLQQRLQQRGFQSWLDYYFYLRYDETATAEWEAVAAALSVLESYFWREYDQIAFLAERLLPEWLAAFPERPVRIWHAGCATGEEPYTLAITLYQKGLLDTNRIQIIGTDINKEALERARRGIYRPRALRLVPPEIRQAFFTPQGDLWVLSEKIRGTVRFWPLNLVDEAGMRMMRGFDAIFCRNVFIYFSTEAIQKVLKHIYQALWPHGVLFLGAAESLSGLSEQFVLTETDGVFYYRKATGA